MAISGPVVYNTSYDTPVLHLKEQPTTNQMLLVMQFLQQVQTSDTIGMNLSDEQANERNRERQETSFQRNEKQTDETIKKLETQLNSKMVNQEIQSIKREQSYQKFDKTCLDPGCADELKTQFHKLDLMNYEQEDKDVKSARRNELPVTRELDVKGITRANRYKLELDKERENAATLKKKLQEEKYYVKKLTDSMENETRRFNEIQGTLEEERKICDETKEDIQKELEIEMRYSKLFEDYYVNKTKETLLERAAARCNLADVKLLIERGASIFGMRHEKESAVYAAINGKCVDVLRLFFKDSEMLNLRDSNGGTLLHFAAYHSKLEIVKMLVDMGVAVNSTDVNNSTPLHYAADQPDLAVVKYLVANGAEFRAVNRFGVTPRMYAETRGQTKIASWLRSLE